VEKANVLPKLKHSDHNIGIADGQHKYLEAVTAVELGFSLFPVALIVAGNRRLF